jgi:hypothetical protein
VPTIFQSLPAILNFRLNFTSDSAFGDIAPAGIKNAVCAVHSAFPVVGVSDHGDC